MSSKKWCISILTCGLAMLLTVSLAQAQPGTEELAAAKPAEKGAGTFSYAVKFVCGFNNSNLGVLPGGVPGEEPGGEATVKVGNYATDINIFNPGNDVVIKKKVLVLVKEGDPVGREPKVVKPEDETVSLPLPNCNATMDDCNEILRLAGAPPAPGLIPGLWVGFLVITSSTELDVTAVYTAEICSDFVLNPAGSAGMCQTPASVAGVAAYGAGISIDVEQIKGTYVPW